GNRHKLENFQEFKGGNVTFGGGEGKITGKVSQIYDKKNKTATTPYEPQKPKDKNGPDDDVNVYLYRSTWQPLQQPATFVTAFAAANNLCCILQSIMQPLWQPSQQPASSIASITVACNLCSSLQLMWQPSQQLATYVAAFVAAFVATCNLCGSLRSSQQSLLRPLHSVLKF
ncbi:hypothetical protein Tco_1362935, partial [Tanacetum coccineum]